MDEETLLLIANMGVGGLILYIAFRTARHILEAFAPERPHMPLCDRNGDYIGSVPPQTLEEREAFDAWLERNRETINAKNAVDLDEIGAWITRTDAQPRDLATLKNR